MSRDAKSFGRDIVTVDEREHKLAIDWDFTLPDLTRALSGGEHIAARQPVVLEAVYFDTSDSALMNAGVTLRRRSGGVDAGWHLKLPRSTPDLRTEFQLPPDSTGGSIPKEFKRRVAELTSGRKLKPVLHIRTDRTVTDVFGADSKVLAELADDYVLTVRLGDLALKRWRELEIEEHGADRKLIKRLVRLLSENGARRSPDVSKFVHGLSVDRTSRGPLVGPFDQLSTRIRTQTAELILSEAALRIGRQDSVHQMRVATRRLRSCLRTFQSAFVNEPGRLLKAELKWLGGRLGGERDAEVIAQRVARDLGKLPLGQTFGSAKATLESRSSGEVVGAHGALISAIDSDRYRALLQKLTEFALAPPYRRRKRRRRWLRRRLAAEMHRTGALVVRANSLHGEARDIALHEVRKEMKHVRYAAETLAPMFGHEAYRIVKTFTTLQEILGEHHDATVTRKVFFDEGENSMTRSGESGFTYGVLFAREDRRARLAEAEFAAEWKKAVRHFD